MLDYIDRMTRDAVQLGREDIARLREVGFDDTAILQMTLIGVVVQLHQPGGRCAGRGPGLSRTRLIRHTTRTGRGLQIGFHA